MKNGSGMLAAVDMNHRTIEYLIGDRAIPRIKVPTTFGKANGELQAVIYASTMYDLWHGTPGAAEWLRLCHNTRWTHIHVSDLKIEHPRPESKKFEFYQRLLREGLYDDVPLDGVGSCLVHEVVMGAATSVEHLRLYLKRYRAKTSFHLSPLNMACYYDVDPVIIGLLMDAGDDIYPPGRDSSDTPLAMAANQGNWRTIKYVLESRPEMTSTPKKKEMLLKFIAEALCSTSVPDCLRGIEKCTRCLQKDRSHPPTCDFNKAADVVIANGLPLDFRPSSPNHPCTTYILKKLKEKKQQGQVPAKPKEPGVSAAAPVEAKKPPKATTTTAAASTSPAPVQANVAAVTAALGKVELLSTSADNKEKKGVKGRTCAFCAIQAEGMLMCSRCKGAWYCSKFSFFFLF